MKISANAGSMASALALILPKFDQNIRRFAALGAVRIETKTDAVELSVNVLDYFIVAKVPATISEPGVTAVSATSLAALAGGFPDDAETAISADDLIATITCARGRYCLPVLADLPVPLVIAQDEVTGHIDLAGDAVLHLFNPLFLRRPSARVTTSTVPCGIASTATLLAVRPTASNCCALPCQPISFRPATI
jgi:hypothetical protein